MTIYTAGYEGMTIDAFINHLHRAGIDKVLDVREYPLSRKPGFSKKSFCEKLNAAGIAYKHSPPFGCPKDIRKRYKLDGDWNVYSKDFRAYIKEKAELLHELITESGDANVCMVCYEADHNYCHRSLIAEAAKKIESSLLVVHLSARTTQVGRSQKEVA
jgi:uncharacterized protein (DUF488 family)